jgi:hypothetical protein
VYQENSSGYWRYPFFQGVQKARECVSHWQWAITLANKSLTDAEAGYSNRSKWKQWRSKQYWHIQSWWLVRRYTFCQLTGEAVIQINILPRVTVVPPEGSTYWHAKIIELRHRRRNADEDYNEQSSSITQVIHWWPNSLTSNIELLAGLRSDTLVLHLGRYQWTLSKETLSKEKMASYLPLWCAIEMLTLTTRCLDFMGTNELMLSDHTAIIDVTTIQGDIYILWGHTYTYWLTLEQSQLLHFDDKEADLHLISRADQYYRWSFSTKGGSVNVRQSA